MDPERSSETRDAGRLAKQGDFAGRGALQRLAQPFSARCPIPLLERVKVSAQAQLRKLPQRRDNPIDIRQFSATVVKHAHNMLHTFAERIHQETDSWRMPMSVESRAYCQPLCSISAATTVNPNASNTSDTKGGFSNPFAPKQGSNNSGKTSPEQEERILISEVQIRGASAELEKVANDTLSIKPNFAYTLEEVQEDVNRIYSTGYFSECQPSADDTRDGVRVTIKVKPNPELKGLIINGADALPQRVVEDAFKNQYGKTLNFNTLQAALKSVNNWYEERGIFGQIVDADLSAAGVCTLKVQEAIVSKVGVRVLDRETGEPTKGRTREEIIMRQVSTRPGQVYSLRQARRDIDAVYSMGIMEDVNMLPQPAEEPGEVDLTLNVVERKSGSFSAGGGLSARGLTEGAFSGFVGSCAYTQRNLFGLNHKLSASLEAGQADSVFKVNYTDPWVWGDKFRTSRTVSVTNNKSSGNAVHGKMPQTGEASNGSAAAGAGEGGVMIQRLQGGVEYSRPLSVGRWNGTAGITWQRTGLKDEQGRRILVDAYGSPLTYTGTLNDTMLVSLLRLVYNATQSDAQLVLSTEQALPVRPDWLNFNRLQVRAERTMALGPARLSALAKGGSIIGDLPPYEAFPIGGTNSVRGYDDGAVGSGRNYIVASGEVSVPLVNPFEGLLFADYGSDLDSGSSVLGDPAGTRGKPGAGFGYGAGVRLDSPVGPLRLEYAFNDKGARRFHFGIGKSF